MTLALIGIWVVCYIISMAAIIMHDKEVTLFSLITPILIAPIFVIYVFISFADDFILWKASSTEKKR